MRRQPHPRTPEGDTRVAELAAMTPAELAKVVRADLAGLVEDIGCVLAADPLDIEHLSPAVPSEELPVTGLGASLLYLR